MPPKPAPGRPGAWPSPISTADVVRAATRPGHPSVAGALTWWEEDRPAEGGRRTVVHVAADGTRRELLPAPWDVRTRVHEYGGRSHVVAPGAGLVFANHADQRLYLLPDGGGDPRPLTPEPEVECGLRYADPVVRDGEIWCVQERHTGDGKVTRSIVSVPLDGGEVRHRVGGHDFFASPVVSPGGTHLAYVCWDHPSMPWTGTELRVVRLSGGDPVCVRGGRDESVLAPRWKDDGTLYFVTDRSGWWNLEEITLTGGSRALYPAGEEFGEASGELGGAPYAVLGDGRLAVLRGRGELRLGVLDPATGTLTDLATPFDGWLPCLAADGATVCGVAYGPALPRSVVRVDVTTGRVETLRREPVGAPAAYMPVPRPVEITGPDGRVVHAIVYPPANPAVPATGGPAPYVVFAHGGPAARAIGALDPHKAFLTSRGIGVLDVNYGGSTGYGRAYRDRLRGRWGAGDVEDVVAAAEWLVTEGLADPERVAIRGRGAGGWTAMAACCASGVFRGGVSVSGAGALKAFTGSTHDFESRYVEWLVGPPDPLLYASREPMSRLAGLRCPMLLMHGRNDPVVPAAQAEAVVSALTERGVPCAYLSFDGEGHEFRRAETRSAVLAAELAFYQQIFRS
ncbi:prolyl oligopeptidase family serine peptidase [Sphaerisporangium rubeum]|uniref:S9 family peptidase n=1 Tax=Sphaerisporangium rubeum TaxID=321317 RepID=UPI0031DB67B3